MAIRPRFSKAGQGAGTGAGAGQGGAPAKPPAPLRRLAPSREAAKVVNESADADPAEEVVNGDGRDDRLAELTERVAALEESVKELTETVERHEAEIDDLKRQVNANGDLAQMMIQSTAEVSASLGRADRLMQTLSQMLGTVIPLFQELGRPVPMGLSDALRRLQEEHDYIRFVALARAAQDAAHAELNVSFVDDTGTRH